MDELSSYWGFYRSTTKAKLVPGAFSRRLSEVLRWFLGSSITLCTFVRRSHAQL